MSATIDNLQAVYDAFTGKIGMMLASCKTPAQRKQITDQYEDMEKHYDKAILKVYKDNTPEAMQLIAQAAVAAKELQTINSQLGDFTKVIGYAVDAATIAVKIEALV